MKSSLLLSAVLLLGVCASKAQNDGPVMTFEFEKYDFGDLKEGGEASVDFKFTNTGNKNLIIIDAVGSCSCTASSWPKEPVMPGEKSVIKASYDTKGKSGPFNKTITITSNATEETKRIFIKGNVIGGSGTTKGGTEEKSDSPLSDE